MEFDIINKLNTEDRVELLKELLDTFDMDTKYAVILHLEADLKASNYDWLVFDREDKKQ